MKKTIINIVAAVALLGGLAASVTAPWWVVWFVCFPLIYGGGITLIKVNTDWIENY